MKKHIWSRRPRRAQSVARLSVYKILQNYINVYKPASFWKNAKRARFINFSTKKNWLEKKIAWKKIEKNFNKNWNFWFSSFRNLHLHRDRSTELISKKPEFALARVMMGHYSSVGGRGLISKSHSPFWQIQQLKKPQTHNPPNHMKPRVEQARVDIMPEFALDHRHL